MATDARDLADAPPLGPDVEVLPMRPRHLARVVAIEERTFSRPWPRAIFQSELRKPGRRYVVGRLGRRIVGYGGVLEQAGDVHITTVAVDPDVQGRGVAGRLVFELLLLAREVAASDGGATLEVRASNEAAQRLYVSFGFETEGRRPGYYADNGEDALIMWRRGLHGPETADVLERWSRRLGRRLPTSGEAGDTPTTT